MQYKGKCYRGKYIDGVLYFNIGTISTTQGIETIRITKSEIGRIRQPGLLDKQRSDMFFVKNTKIPLAAILQHM